MKSLDLDTLKRYSLGELSPKKFLEIHQDAGELLDLLYQNLNQAEHVVSIQDWPLPRRKKKLGQFIALKSMLLFTPFMLIVGGALMNSSPLIGSLIMFGWLSFCVVAATLLLWQRNRVLKSKDGRSVLVVTNRRMMRVWLDGSETVQAWWLSDDTGKKKLTEPVPATISLLLELDLGKPSLN